MKPSDKATETARWIERVTPVLEEFSDRQIQERRWLDGSSSEESSPTELICMLLDTLQFDDASQDPSIDLTDAQRASCVKFAKMVDAFVDSHKRKLGERDVINDPDWEKIRAAAADLLKVLPS